MSDKTIEDMAKAKADAKPKVEITMSEELKQKLSDEKILEEDIADVVDFCERTGRTVHNTETDTYSGYRQIGYGTYWVEYKRGEQAGSVDDSKHERFEVVNAYSHRMEIELEEVWNGHKIEIDV